MNEAEVMMNILDDLTNSEIESEAELFKGILKDFAELGELTETHPVNCNCDLCSQLFAVGEILIEFVMQSEV